MDMQTFNLVLHIAQVVVIPSAVWIVKVVLDQRKQLAQLDVRMTRAETCLANAPTEKTLHELALTIRSFGGDLHVAVEKIEGMGRIVDRLERVVSRHEEFLLNSGGR